MKNALWKYATIMFCFKKLIWQIKKDTKNYITKNSSMKSMKKKCTGK